MQEIWKDVKGYEGLYQVSSHGNIKSLDRVVSNHQGSGIRKGKTMSFTVCKGYYRVIFTRDAMHFSPFVQRVVAEAFIPNPENKKEVNHINGIKTDNRVENLEWCTPSENVKHAYKTGLKKAIKGVDNYRSKKVVDTVTGKIFDTATDAAKAFGIKQQTLSKKLRGDRANNTALKFLSECA